MIVNTKKNIKINFEFSDLCNAGCPLCSRHKKGTSIAKPWVNTGSMTLDNFKKWFPKDLVFKLKAIVICGNYGDPMMAKDMPYILEYVNENRHPWLYVSIHTNGGARSANWWSKLGKEMSSIGHDSHIVFWIDGLEDTLHIYRRGVDYNKVIDNAKTFMSNGGQAHWGFLKFKHNEHQLEEVHRRAKEFGFKCVSSKAVSGLRDTGEVEVDIDNVKRVRGQK